MVSLLVMFSLILGTAVNTGAQYQQATIDHLPEYILDEPNRKAEPQTYYGKRYEYEPNDLPRQADWTYPDTEAYGRIQKSGDVDYWKVKLAANTAYLLRLDNIPRGMSYRLFFFDEQQRELAKSDKKGAASQEIRYETTGGGWHYIAIKGTGTAFDKQNYYRLKVTAVPQAIKLTPDEFESNDTIKDAKTLIWGPKTNTKANIHSQSDVDYFKLSLRVASTIELTLQNIPDKMDLNLELLDEQGRLAAKAESQSNETKNLSYNGDPGTYYVKIYAAPNSVILPHQYTVNASVHQIPVILIPGIGGSRLTATEGGKSTEAWLDIKGMPLDYVHAVHRKVLPLVPVSQGSTEVVQKTKGVEIAPEEGDHGLRAISFLSYTNMVQYKTKQYRDMISALHYLGYSKGKSLFGFPYDWRLSNTTNADKLLQAIDDALATSKANQVQLVAHSMGGLLVKETLLSNPSYQKKVRRIIYMGTPFLGSPRAFQAIKFGYTFGIPIFSQETARQLAQFAPAVYELLPSRTYVEKQGYLNLIGVNVKRPFTYDEIKQDSRLQLAYRPLANMAERLHEKWDNLRLSVPQYVIVGDGQQTMLGYDFHQSMHQFKPYYGETGGDGTVPLVSADHSLPDIKQKYYVAEEHAKLPSNKHVIEQVSNLLKGNEELAKKGVRKQPMTVTATDYFLIYRTDGKLPDVTLRSGEETFRTTELDKQHELVNFAVEYHGNLLAVFMKNESRSLMLKPSAGNRLDTLADDFVIERYHVTNTSVPAKKYNLRHFGEINLFE